MANRRKHLKGKERQQALLERYHRSGTTQRAFCESEGLPLSTLQSWLTRERRSGTPAFTEIRATSTESTTVELLFPDGTALRIRSA